MCGQKPMTAPQQLSEDSLLEDNMRFHGIVADWVTDFKAEVEQRFNKKPFSQELSPPSWTVFYCLDKWGGIA